MTAMLIGFVSAKGSPGVTTAALAFAATTSRNVGSAQPLLVELDPSGGVIECWTGVAHEPGLSRVASGLRRSLEVEVVEAGIRPIPAGVAVVHAPTSGTLAESTIAAIGERLTIAMAESDRLVIIDAGRWCRSQSTARRIVGCDVIVIVCQPTVAGVEAARALFDPIHAITNLSPVLLLVGERPYSAGEVAEATGVTVIGTLPWDPHAVNTLLASGAVKSWSRSSLARSARTILTHVAPAQQATTTAVAS
jgi:Flp pilus assembly CpaE family ATPase